MAFVQKASTTLYSGSSIAPSLAGVTAGNLLVLVVHYIHTASTAPAAPTGYTAAENPAPVATAAAGGYYTGVAIYYKENASSGTNTPSVSFTGTSWALAMLAEFSGYATSSSLDVHAHNTSALTTNYSGDTGTTGTTSQANELVIAAFTPSAVTGASNITLTNPPTGFTSLYVQQDSGTYLLSGESAYKEVTSTGTQTAAYSWSVADHGEFAGAIATFKAASGGTSITSVIGHGTFHGYTPTISQPHAVTSVIGHGTFTGYTPTIAQPHAVTGVVGHITATGYAPSIAQPHSVTSVVGHAGFTGYVPSIAQPIAVLAEVWHGVFTGYAPTIDHPGAVNVTPDIGRGAFTGYAPYVSQVSLQSGSQSGADDFISTRPSIRKSRDEADILAIVQLLAASGVLDG